MDKIILGLLMLKRLTVYELRSLIRGNFQSICSDSLGSIQAAIKKLMTSQMVTCSEHVEKGINKKRYSITDAGRKALMDWLQTPADMAASKNMEIGKLLFMGLVPADKRLPLIDAIILNLETELSGLLGVWHAIQSAEAEDEMTRIIEHLRNDHEYCEGIQNATQNTDIMESAKGIGTFEIMTLRYGIDSINFNIDWFRALQEKIVSGELRFPPAGFKEEME